MELPNEERNGHLQPSHHEAGQPITQLLALKGCTIRQNTLIETLAKSWPE